MGQPDANGRDWRDENGGCNRQALTDLDKQGREYGLQTMCEGGGIANVTIVEAL